MRVPITALALALSSPVLAAESPLGRWHVAGSVSGHDFTLDCRFVPAGAGFGGTCTEVDPGNMGHPGKVRVLTRGTIADDRLTWAYPVSVMFMHFDMTFEGTLANSRITGTASASGRKGSFSAHR